jgi:hypothetical protein
MAALAITGISYFSKIKGGIMLNMVLNDLNSAQLFEAGAILYI